MDTLGSLPTQVMRRLRAAVHKHLSCGGMSSGFCLSAVTGGKSSLVQVRIWKLKVQSYSRWIPSRVSVVCHHQRTAQPGPGRNSFGRSAAGTHINTAILFPCCAEFQIKYLQLIEVLCKTWRCEVLRSIS